MFVDEVDIQSPPDTAGTAVRTFPPRRSYRRAGPTAPGGIFGSVRVPRHAADLGLVARTMPANARAAAFELFAVLREFDALGVGLIWVEQPPSGGDWDGVRDRLQRAAAAAPEFRSKR